MFTESNALYALGQYSVHITDKIRKVLLAKGYILVVISGRITGNVQCNDTHVHHLLKKKYRKLEAELMTEMLRKDPNKILSLMKMLSHAWNSLDRNVEEALTQSFLASTFDGSEGYRVSEKLCSLVFEEIKDF